MERRSAREATEYNVRAIERALQILNYFDDLHPENTLSEVAQATGLHRATTHRIMTTLVNYGYLEKLSQDQGYRLGRRVIDLGLSALHRVDLRREALPTMQAIVAKLEESCDIGILDRKEVLIVEVVRSPHGHALATSLWKRLPIHATASGKLLLAHLPSAQVNEVLAEPLPAYTSNTITDPNKLRIELEVIKRQGYAIDNEEFEVGVCGVAAPIRGIDGTLVAALGVPGPAGRITIERASSIATTLTEAAESISRRLGWQP